MDNSESGDDMSHGFLEPEDNTDDSNTDQYKNTPLREQDRFLPIANIAKIMKRAIPDNGKIAKDAREIIQECVSEFISFITSEASDRCHFEKRKTINGEDILFAMNTLGFDNYVEPLKMYLHKYREAIPNTVKVDKGPTGEILYAISYDDKAKHASVQILSENGQQTDNAVTQPSYNWNMNAL